MNHLKKFCFVVLALLATTAHASYSWTPTIGLGDNTAWCASNNCLTSIGGVTAETKAGADGTIYGLTSALYTYTKATGWVQAPSALQTAGGYALKHISVGRAGHVLAVTTATSNNVYTLNSGGTAWQVLPGGGTVATAEIGADGAIWGITAAQTIYYYSNGSWTQVAGGAVSLAVGEADNVWVVNSSNQLFRWNGSAWSQATSLVGTPSTALNALAASGCCNLAFAGTGGYINLSTTSGATWTRLLNQSTAVTTISGGAHMYFARNSSGVSYHVNLFVPAVTNTAAGFWACPPADGCPTGSYHTLYATVRFGGSGGAHGTAGVTTQTSGYPESQIQTAATENASYCDPFFGDPNSPSCLAYYAGNAICSVMGQLTSLVLTTFPYHLGAGYTLVENQSGPGGFGCETNNGVTICSFLVSESCTNTPQWAPQIVDDGPPASAGWYSNYYCTRFSSSQPWTCQAIGGAASKTADRGPVYCPFYALF